MGVPAGLVLANLAFLVTSRAMDPGAFINWGWRIPFLLSVVLVGLALFVQRHIEDSEVFRRQKVEGTSASPILEALRQYPSQIVLAAGAHIASNATFHVLVTFVVAYGTSTSGLQIPRATMLTAVLISAGFMPVALIAAGAWSNRFGRRGVYRASLGYRIGAIFGGGFAPIIAASLMVEYHNSVAISIYVAAVCAVSFLSVTLLRETHRVDLNRAIVARDLRDWLVGHGADSMSMTQPEFARFVLEESERAARIIKATGIKRQ